MKISMDGKGRYQGNIFVERLWRTVKYEEVYLKAYVNAVEVRRELGAYFRFYNNLKPHQAWATDPGRGVPWGSDSPGGRVEGQKVVAGSRRGILCGSGGTLT